MPTVRVSYMLGVAAAGDAGEGCAGVDGVCGAVGVGVGVEVGVSSGGSVGGRGEGSGKENGGML